MPWSGRPLPRRRPKRRTGLWVALALGVAVLGVGAGAIGALLVPGSRPAAQQPGAGTSGTPNPAAATTAGGAVAPAAVRVVDLMNRAGCRGGVIGTQLYSTETGRCNLPGGAEVTLATFTSDQLRDQWVTTAKEYGGSFARGPGWAAMASSPSAAATVASKLGGQRA